MIKKDITSRYPYRCVNCGKNMLKPSAYKNGCKKCLVDSPEVYAELMYSKLKNRQKTTFRYPVPFTLEEFRGWLAKIPHYKSMFKEYLRIREKNGNATGYAPCVDRIENWKGYSLDNIQLVTHSDNASKREGVGLGAQEKTMRFFKRLREKLGFTKYEMANHLGMLPPTYYYYEDKAKGCSFEVLSMIREKLNLSWEELGQYIDEEYGEDTREEITATRRKPVKKRKLD